MECQFHLQILTTSRFGDVPQMDVNSNKLLIVDNDPMARKYTRHRATLIDYDVEESKTASEALI